MVVAAVAIGFGLLVSLPILWALTLAPPARVAVTPESPSATALADIPTNWLPLLEASAQAQCSGLSWTILAAIGKVESDFGRSTKPGVHSGTNAAGAMGPMQFLAGTWAAYGKGGDVYSASDAVPAAARYLCANGGGSASGLSGAIWHYNHSWPYVGEVLALAQRYATPVGLQLPTRLGPIAVPVLLGPVGLIQATPAAPLFGHFWPTSFPAGECTYWASENRPDVAWSGDAWEWWANARAKGHAESSQPAVGAIVVWTDHGHYSAFGHLAVVVGLDPGGFTVSEMNYIGLGVVDQRVSPFPDPQILGFIN